MQHGCDMVSVVVSSPFPFVKGQHCEFPPLEQQLQAVL
jgi:hypothetical protein